MFRKKNSQSTITLNGDITGANAKNAFDQFEAEIRNLLAQGATATSSNIQVTSYRGSQAGTSSKVPIAVVIGVVIGIIAIGLILIALFFLFKYQHANRGVEHI